MRTTEYFLNSDWKSSSLRELVFSCVVMIIDQISNALNIYIVFLSSISFSFINFCDFLASDSRWSGSLLLRSAVSQPIMRS